MRCFFFVLLTLSAFTVSFADAVEGQDRKGPTPAHHAVLKGLTNGRINRSLDKTYWEEGGEILTATLYDSKPIDAKLCANVCKHILHVGLLDKDIRFFLKDGRQYAPFLCGKGQADYERCDSLLPISDR